MAKKSKSSDSAAALFPDFRRRHPHLILPKLLSEKAMVFPFDEARLKAGIAILENWSDLAAIGALRQKIILGKPSTIPYDNLTNVGNAREHPSMPVSRFKGESVIDSYRHEVLVGDMGAAFCQAKR